MADKIRKRSLTLVADPKRPLRRENETGLEYWKRTGVSPFDMIHFDTLKIVPPEEEYLVARALGIKVEDRKGALPR